MIQLNLQQLDPDVSHTFFQKAKQKTFKKGECLVELGTVCTEMFFIEKGMIRNFYYDKNGNDITHWFANEAMIVTIPPSFFKKEESNFGIEAIEDTTVRSISYSDLEQIIEHSIALEKFFRELLTEVMLKLGEKIVELQTSSAEERYDKLILTHPDIFQRAKLGHIAGYLGIKPQSLSRIRAQKSH